MADTGTGGKTVVTSFNEEGYNRYGREFVRTFLQFWPKTKLVIFYEGDFDMDVQGASWRPIEEVEGWPSFEAKLFPLMTGGYGGRYDINFDARMCRKLFIECHALKKYGGKVFWIDADTITHTQVPETFLDEVLPDDKFNCYLGRDGWYYTESGFIGFNADHPMAERFMDGYRGFAETGFIFTQPGWHDCYAFDAMRKLVKNPDEFVNLAKDLPHGTMHVQVNSILGKYMTHMKGDRKDTGQLREGDIVKLG
jgi:hypothetical protein